jgi:hypothetical protein
MDPTHTKLGADAGRPDDILRGQNEIETLELSPDSGLYTKHYALFGAKPTPPLSVQTTSSRGVLTGDRVDGARGRFVSKK